MLGFHHSGRSWGSAPGSFPWGDTPSVTQGAGNKELHEKTLREMTAQESDSMASDSGLF